jgi:hypothetical protein
MLNHPFRALGSIASILFTAGLAWALTIGGYSLDDPQIEEERLWVQALKYDQPDLSRSFARQCKGEIGRSPWTRDGAMALFRCIREKGEAAGYFYE